MENNKKKDNLLSTWKEIASYLNCTDRTCRRWEAKCGLPVHRIDGSPKSKVFALKEELDDWLSHRKQSSKAIIRIFITKKFLFPVSIAVPIIGLAFISLTSLLSHQAPADFTIDGSTLSILSDRGRTLWEYNTGIENLIPEEQYHAHFLPAETAANTQKESYIIIKDLDQDNRLEILFSIQTEDELGEGGLICFDRKGGILWEIQTGREMKYGENLYSPDYRIHYMDTADVDQDGDLEIFLVSAQRYFFPTQFLLLDHQGQTLGEYWNAGRITDFAVADTDHDGKQEILLTGCNNAYNKSCLIVFDQENINGHSPQAAGFTSPSFRPGTEKFYLLFPNNDVSLLENPRSSIDQIDIQSNQKILLRESSSVLYYELNFSMKLEKIMFSDAFRQKHKKAKEEGHITSDADDAYLEALSRQVLYWDGSDWGRTPNQATRKSS